MRKLLPILIILSMCHQAEALSPNSIIARQRINRVRVIYGRISEDRAKEITQIQKQELRLRWRLYEEGYAAARARNRAHQGAHDHRLRMQGKVVFQPVYQNPLRKPLDGMGNRIDINLNGAGVLNSNEGQQ